MLTSHEIFTKKVIPYIKALIAIKLINNGHTQIEVSRILGVSQAAISQYLSNGETYYRNKLQDIGINEELYIDGLEELSSQASIPDTTEIIMFINDLWVRLINSGRLCRIHKRFNILLNNCNVCLFSNPMMEVNDREKVLNELKRAFKILSKIPEFKILIPEVYSNLARALPNPTSIRDIAAFPGRIIPVGKYIKTVGDPAFGASKHLAKILLMVTKLYPNILAIMNIKYDDMIYKAVKRSGLSHAYTIKRKGEKGDDAVINGLRRVIERRGIKNVIFDRGGEGLEPVTYIFGTDSYDIVDKVVSIIWGLRSAIK